MTAAERIAAALGRARRSGRWWSCCCPAHDDPSPSLSIRVGRGGGLIAVCHAGCSRTDVLGELSRRGLYAGEGSTAPVAADPQAKRLRRQADEADRARRIAEALDIWTDSYPADATTQVPRYLRSRGWAGPIPATIRVHGMHGLYGRHPTGERWPQMIALIEHVEHGPVGVSRTFLRPDGSAKAAIDPVRLFRGAVRGGAARLAPAAETLLVGEGIETTLAGIAATGLPGWAALSTSGLVALIMPPIVRSVIVLADHDISGAGERAAQTAAARWLAEGRRVQIYMSPRVGEDAADLILAAAIGACDAA
jgi:hypothetical protein